MQPGQPSRTALGAATHRAVHNAIEGGAIFSDALAAPILGKPHRELEREAHEEPERRPMRFFVCARARLADEAIAHAVARGVRQLVVLGAGLDTFAYRNPHPGLRVFEVDHPATQAWKRERLEAIGVPAPASLTFAPVDFEKDALGDALARAGFDERAGSFFSWLGVVPYLSEEAVFRTLAVIAGLPGGSDVIFDYGEPVSMRSPEHRAAFEARATRVAALGEPWISFFEPMVLAARLREIGYQDIEDWDVRALIARFAPGAPAPRDGGGGHVLRAGKPSNGV